MVKFRYRCIQLMLVYINNIVFVTNVIQMGGMNNWMLGRTEVNIKDVYTASGTIVVGCYYHHMQFNPIHIWVGVAYV